jgi:hypothetical protein
VNNIFEISGQLKEAIEQKRGFRIVKRATGEISAAFLKWLVPQSGVTGVNSLTNTPRPSFYFTNNVPRSTHLESLP